MEYRGRIDGDEILNSKWLELRLFKDGQEAAALARRRVDSQSGRLRRSIHVEVDKRSGAKRDRTTVRVVASAIRATPEPPYDYALGNEFGNSQTRGSFYLRSSLPL